MNLKTFNLLLIISLVFYSCSGKWNGEYSNDDFSVQIPQEPTESNVSMKYALGEIDFKLVECGDGEGAQIHYRVYYGQLPEFSEEDIEAIAEYGDSEEARLFRTRNSDADDLDNVFLSSIEIVRESIGDMELYNVENKFYKEHLGKSYFFYNSKSDFMHRIDAYIIEDHVFILSVKGAVTRNKEKEVENFFDNFEVFNVEEYQYEEGEKGAAAFEAPQEVKDTINYPNFEFYISAQHRYKPVDESYIISTDYGYATLQSKHSMPPAANDPNRFYRHSMVDFQRDLRAIDTFDLHEFYKNFSVYYTESLGATILDTGYTVLGGLTAYEVEQKSRTGKEYCKIKIALDHQYLYMAEIMSNKGNLTNSKSRKFFRSVRIRKEKPNS